MRRVVIIISATVGISAGLFAATGVAQSSAAEQAIRAQIEMRDKRQNAPIATKDGVFWSGAYSKPQFIGRPANPTEAVAAPGRKNVVGKTQVQRIVVATGGDMAYEYSTFTLSFDDDTGHSDLAGAVLCVWQLSGSEWRVAAEFRRPYGGVVPLQQGR
jgi:ketosteroid isomerase-like protein